MKHEEDLGRVKSGWFGMDDKVGGRKREMKEEQSVVACMKAQRGIGS